MLKNIIATSLVAATLMFSGCGDTEGETRLSAQTAIDSGNFALAISAIEAKTDKSDSDNLILASAHMGEAGFTLVDIVNSLQVQAANPSDDALTTFRNSILSGVTDTSATLTNLTKAIQYYEAVVGTDSNASNVEELSDTQLQLGLAHMVKISILISDVGSDNAEVASSANDAFNYISSVGTADIKEDIESMKLEAFGTNAEITPALIANYKSTL